MFTLTFPPVEDSRVFADKLLAGRNPFNLTMTGRTFQFSEICADALVFYVR